MQRMHGRWERPHTREYQDIRAAEHFDARTYPNTKTKITKAVNDRGMVTYAVINDAYRRITHSPNPTLNLRRMEPSAFTEKSSRFAEARTCSQNLLTGISI